MCSLNEYIPVHLRTTVSLLEHSWSPCGNGGQSRREDSEPSQNRESRNSGTISGVTTGDTTAAPEEEYTRLVYIPLQLILYSLFND